MLWMFPGFSSAETKVQVSLSMRVYFLLLTDLLSWHGSHILVVASLVFTPSRVCESQPQLSDAHSLPPIADQIFKQVSILSTWLLTHSVVVVAISRFHTLLTHKMIFHLFCSVSLCVFFLWLMCAEPFLFFFFSKEKAVGGWEMHKKTHAKEQSFLAFCKTSTLVSCGVVFFSYLLIFLFDFQKKQERTHHCK